MKVSTPGPLYAGIAVPFGKLAGEGSGSYCLEGSQYCSNDLEILCGIRKK